ncbi:rho GTPase-activating protein 15 [Apteryx mantelli]|uniref:Rho GTPase-activating protein 15 n=2 Tax=Apteryx TaxID=8821 RepID=A0A8B9QCI2_APTOW|nr:PREDICTED: rho GTPase-activating protein 15 [Apteryx mantelli mantelli]XP_025944845.1 rho GTPase-activating protein 15 [Apteryx rowi]XP_025944846.1 rho GTPase-activating protein 15 [Apteryx rowi]XP_025944847.1 rho GTPase-activating protein 15 [Apteryx rowi]XP_025944848.1 rho GTPase-activating protein 15 [Apteryx rowi]XP_025944849.1 rho GTPase-activating protein 15 [Apteryx rowi]XP_025944850.1 rho GTPase-activating protein 15 [Apteryx rowi]
MERSTASDMASEKPNPSHHSTGAVQMRIKSANSHHDRLSQSKSMILSENVKVAEPVNRHRRNHSQHNLTLADIISTQDHTVVEKEGYLLKAKIADGGKKLRKNWSTSWIVLTARKMEFYKESKQPALANLKPGYKPECVDLCGARIEWTPEKSSRKNVFQITTVSGNEFLLQSDIDFLILDWFHAIKNAIDRLPKEQSCTSRNLEFKLRRSSSIELLNSLDTESKEPKAEHRKSLIFRLNYSASDTNDRNRVKSRLKKFISRRPSLKTLQEKGLIKDQIFGSHLHLVCEHENSTVPQFVRLCIEAVERRGLDVDGIYRVSGNLATIQKLRFVVNQEEKLNLDDSQWEDIHVVTGALKMFFRELPEPLFPYCFFEQFVEAIKIQDNAIRIKSIKRLVKKLPRPNYETMKILFEHLKKIAAKESVNLMSTQSLGIVFGPTLLRPEKETGNMAVHMLYQNQIVELMLSEYSKIFGSEED